ncbi:DoxX family protein [Streptomyces hypolithicus]
MSEATATPARAVVDVPAAAVAVPSRRMYVTVRIFEVLLALFFAVPSAGPKLVGHSSATEIFDTIGFGDWFMYLVGALELAGAIALLIPALAGVSAIALSALMVGAFVTQVLAFDGQNAATPLIVMVPLAVIAWTRRHRTAELPALVRRRLA